MSTISEHGLKPCQKNALPLTKIGPNQPHTIGPTKKGKQKKHGPQSTKKKIHPTA